MNEPQDIRVKVWDTEGMPMEFIVSWDADLDEWQDKLKLILTYLQFYVERVEINPESDDPQGEKDE
jgi:hypothetical protein